MKSKRVLIPRRTMEPRLRLVVYRIWAEHSETSRVGYIGKDTDYPSRLYLKCRVKERSSRKLFAAFQKYPLLSWHVEILEAGFDSFEDLAAAEIKWIAYFDSKNKGYNCTDGGEGVVGLVQSEEAKKSRRWKPRDPQEVVRLYRDDKLSLTKLESMFKITRHTIRDFLKREGIPIRSCAEIELAQFEDFNRVPKGRHSKRPDLKDHRSRRRWKPENPQELIERFLSGETLKSLSRRYNVGCHNTIKFFLLDNDVPLLRD